MEINYTDRITPTSNGLTTYLDELISNTYQIPTFQRDIVWESENVKKLWDSIYKFYPLGSILIWKTRVQLQNHRKIGGHLFTELSSEEKDNKYILDGQQRTTSLLTSLYGGSIEGRKGFDPTIYVDLTIPVENETDDESYKDRFLFWSEIDDRNGEIRQNSGRKKRFDDGYIVKLLDVKNRFVEIQTKLFHSELVQQVFQHPIMQELAKVNGVLTNYRISFITISGIQVAEVCQIFERINQAGKPLSIFDIVVAKTFRAETAETETKLAQKGFYLRELIDDFKEQKLSKSEFLNISDMDYLQILAVLINQNVKDTSVRNITDRYLNEIKTEEILEVWESGKKAILKTFDFFENHLQIRSPALVPFRYFYFTITAYFYNNDSPNYDFLKKYFWFNSFHNDDLLSNTTQLFKHIEFINEEITTKQFVFDRFLIDRHKLRNATYSSKGRMSRAILALYASLKPKDWEHCDREVLVQNLFFSSDKPNLHHVFPTNSDYVLNNRHKNKITSDSLMNIVYLTQITNLDITNRDPLEYIGDYDKPEFISILPTHLLTPTILEWAKEGNMPENAIDLFIESRVDKIVDDLRLKLVGVQVSEMDTQNIDSAVMVN